MVHHGVEHGVKFRYVWARPKDSWNMRYHISKQYQGLLTNDKYYNVKGKTYFVGCHTYGKVWRNDQVTTREFKDVPSWATRCEFCNYNLEEFEGKIYSFADGGKKDTTPVHGQYALIKRKEWKRWHLAKVDPKHKDSFWICCGSTIDSKYSPTFDHLDVMLIESNIVPVPYHKVCYHCRTSKKELVKFWQFKTASEIAKEEADQMMKKTDEEDIDVETGGYYAYPCCNSNTCKCEKPKKSKLDKSHMECVKCPLKYTMNNTTYLPEGGEVEVFSEFTGGGRQAHIYRCTCGHPLVVRIAGTVQIWSKVIIGRPIVVI